MSLLRFEEISLSFNAVKALTSVTFEVARHEICALVGPNGAGKSSLLNVVSGVYVPETGRVVFDGESHSRMMPRDAARRGIARTFQSLAVFKGMTVLDNVLTGRNLAFASTWLEQALGVGRARREEADAREHAERVLAFLDLEHHRHATAATLPYGLQKRVDLARALASQPKLLLLDEPMAGMSAVEKREMSDFVLAANREFGTTVLLIEHDMGVVMNLSDHVVVLDYGRKVGDGPPDVVRSDPEVLRAYLGTKSGTARGASRGASCPSS